MGKIEVGEYIRTKNKGMLKVCSLRKTPYGYLCGTTDNENISHFTIGKGGHSEIKNNIIKHSKNIIDLIEVGDLIQYDSNNYGTDIIEVVTENCNVNEDYEDGIGFVCTALDSCIRTERIKSILTHEQYENNCYKVKE